MSYIEQRASQWEANMNAALKAGKRDQMKAWQAKWMAANK